MILAEVLAVPVTLSEVDSWLMYQDIMRQQWRCYSPANSGGQVTVDDLVERYLRVHASQPSVITGETHATEPLEVFQCPWGKYTLHGALYMNGAIVHVRVGKEKPYNILYIAEEPAAAWGYPQDFVMIPPPE